MKKLCSAVAAVVLLVALCAVSAVAAENGVVKVGLRYGGDALPVANLENFQGSGYSFGYFDSGRNFTPLGYTDRIAISMSGDSTYHVRLPGDYGSFDQAAAAAAQSGGYPAYVSGRFEAWYGSFGSYQEAQNAAAGSGGSVAEPSPTGVTVTVTGSSTILFQFDCQGALNLGVQPNASAGETVTWFKGYKYRGGFEYQRVTGGGLNVINVVDLEDYVKGVLPYEMGGGWPMEALKAQAVCARTYACRSTKHARAYGFDVCNTTDCQVYNGVSAETGSTNQAVAETAGLRLFSGGELIEALYHSSDGGATEDSANVWGGNTSYLRGKIDPYEATITIPNYQYSVTYTSAELTYVLQNSGYSIGTVTNVYVSERTNMGNVAKVTFVDSSGKTLTVKQEACRNAFASSTYQKYVRSMRFDINGGSGSAAGYSINGQTSLPSLSGVSVISGKGTVGAFGGGTPYVITSSGTSQAKPGTGAPPATGGSTSGVFTITGTGYGHIVGMSQYGANAMAKQGKSFTDILNFYYTGVTIG